MEQINLSVDGSGLKDQPECMFHVQISTMDTHALDVVDRDGWLSPWTGRRRTRDLSWQVCSNGGGATQSPRVGTLYCAVRN